MKTLVIVPILLLFSCSSIFAAEKLPNDVRKFIAQRDACDHFRGALLHKSAEFVIPQTPGGITACSPP